MTVSELIAILQKCDPKVKVYTRFYCEEQISEVTWDTIEKDVAFEPENIFDMDSHVIIECPSF